MIGKTVSHYRIIERLGAGGMGVVYLAEDTVLGRRVAIKTLTTSTGPGNQHFRSRFLREARAVSALSHPHIATIHDYGETDEGQPYIVMEHVRGETLGALMLKEALTIPRSIEIIMEVAEALAEAHRHGIIHRDIKPSNVAINHRGEVKVLDFGLAKQIDLGPIEPTDPERQTLLNTQTREGVIVGTPMYLSPEQALGLEVDARSDLFSLGGLLYECIAGKPPFFGGGPMEICAKVIRDNPLPPSQLNADVPKELDRVVLKALAKTAEGRYQAADEMIADLSAIEAGLRDSGPAVTRLISPDAGTRPSGALSTLSDIFKRPRLSLRFVILGLLVLCLSSVAIWIAIQPKIHQPPESARKWYEIGTNSIREGSFFKAIKPLEQAIAIDSNFALAYARLAEAWAELDYTERSQLALLQVDGLVPNRNKLPEREGLYLDAIRSTITRDFSAAIQANVRIVSISPNSAQAYLDLGRAYERNDEIDQAIQSYTVATTHDREYAAAFLRLGILYGRKGELPKSNEAFDKADALFQALSDFEGRAEVLFQRGTVFARIGKLSDAQERLQSALEMASTSGNHYQQIKAMLQLSSVLHSRGLTEKAKEYANDGVTLAQNNRIENLATQGLIDLGNTYIERREYIDAEQAIRQALEFARRNKGRRNEAMALLYLAKSHIQQEVKTDDAISFLEQALPYFREGKFSKEISLAVLLHGRAKLLKGQYAAALKDFQEQLEFAKITNNPSQLASAYLLVGNLLADIEVYPEALRSFEQSYEIYKTLGSPLILGYLLVDRSRMLWRVGKYDAARLLLKEIPAIADGLDSKYKEVLLARSALVYSEMALSEEQFGEAKSKAELSLQLAGVTPNHTAVTAKDTLALIQIRSGARSLGLRSSQEAVAMARQVNDQYLLSRTFLTLSEGWLENNDAKQSLSAALEAQARFSGGAQYESEWHAWLIAGRASKKLNDESAAREQLAHIDGLLSNIQQKWGPEAFNGYLSRRDTQTTKKQLDDLRASTR